MITVLRRLPFFETSTTALLGNERLTIKPYQIIVWVSITKAGLPEFPPNARRLPAVLDTGFNDTFLIQEQHFTAWAGLSPQDFEVLEFLSVYGRNVPLLDADVWLHRNQRGIGTGCPRSRRSAWS